MKLIHHRLDRVGDAIEVWADDPHADLPRVVTLWFDGDNDAVDLSPAEARGLAALLILAAHTQERAGEQ